MLSADPPLHVQMLPPGTCQLPPVEKSALCRWPGAYRPTWSWESHPGPFCGLAQLFSSGASTHWRLSWTLAKVFAPGLS
jgi:hypothetical protein